MRLGAGPQALRRAPRGAGRLRLAVLVVLALAALAGWARPARAIELCGEESKVLMRSVGVSEHQIAELCRKARQASALLSISLVRRRDELGYCRVTLALRNNSTEYLNALSLASVNGRFEIFRFANILPGGTGYASASSRTLLACDELDALGLTFYWPASIRLGDRPLNGRTLERYRPVLMDPLLAWNR